MKSICMVLSVLRQRRYLTLMLVLSLVMTAQAQTPNLLDKSAAAAATSNSGWVSQNSGVLAKLMSASFADRDHGWIVGSNSTLLFTEDGGQTWKYKQLQDHEMLRSVYFLDDRRGYILGQFAIFNRLDNKFPAERAFLLSTSDAGEYWRTMTLSRPVNARTDNFTRYNGETLLRFVFVDDRTGWACGETGLILATTDGGRSWRAQRGVQARKVLYGISALDQQMAWVVGAGGVALRTVDGGQQWNEQTTGTTKQLNAVQFIDPKRGWAVGAGGTILSSVNGGNRWRLQNAETDQDLTDVFFLNSQEGWVCGRRGTLLHTTNGGVTWEDRSLQTRADLQDLFFVALDCGWVVGANGAIYKYQPVEKSPRPSLTDKGNKEK